MSPWRHRNAVRRIKNIVPWIQQDHVAGGPYVPVLLVDGDLDVHGLMDHDLLRRRRALHFQVGPGEDAAGHVIDLRVHYLRRLDEDMG